MPSSVTYDGPRGKGSSSSSISVDGERFRQGIPRELDNAKLEKELAEGSERLKDYKFTVKAAKAPDKKPEKKG